MPRYDYAPVSGRCKRCDGRFEVIQRVSETKLKRCPTCRKSVERLISAPALGGKYAVTPNKIKELGMTQYKKAGDGYYERSAGTRGPKLIGRNSKVKPSDF
jgi:putative FmdB family regulatory protein